MLEGVVYGGHAGVGVTSLVTLVLYATYCLLHTPLQSQYLSHAFKYHMHRVGNSHKLLHSL
jgi:hypothetical protein